MASEKVKEAKDTKVPEPVPGNVREGYRLVGTHEKAREAQFKAGLKALEAIGITPDEAQLVALQQKAENDNPEAYKWVKIPTASITEAQNRAMNGLYGLMRLKDGLPSEGLPDGIEAPSIEAMAEAIAPLMDRPMAYQPHRMADGEVQYWKGKPVMRWEPLEGPRPTAEDLIKAVNDRINAE